MDVDTLPADRDLWVPDPKPVTAKLSSLTDEEQATFDRLVQ